MATLRAAVPRHCGSSLRSFRHHPLPPSQLRNTSSKTATAAATAHSQPEIPHVSTPLVHPVTASPTTSTTTTTAPLNSSPSSSSSTTTSSTPRLEALKKSATAPFSSFLTDTFARQHTYLRISLTERCNLRCTYCMPAAGVPLSPPVTQLTTPEIALLASLFVSQGVTKIRLTGGEPTVRRDILPLMARLGELKGEGEGKGLRELCITSNGVALGGKIEGMRMAGLTGVNLSLDTLDAGLFEKMTRRRGMEKVVRTMEKILEMNKLGAGIKLKVNVVVMRGVNESEVLKFVELGRDKDLEVRFIEYMPFDENRWAREKMVSYEEMLGMIRSKYPELNKVWDGKNETSKTWQVDGFQGKVGFVTSMTENFCAGCNRLRITSDGNLKVCLFGNNEVSLRDLLRKGNGGEPIEQEAYEAIRAVESARKHGEVKGVLASEEHERELLEVIGAAVGRKKARHAGMGALENMKNRPMILIDEVVASPPPVRTSPSPPALLGRRLLPTHSNNNSAAKTTTTTTIITPPFHRPARLSAIPHHLLLPQSSSPNHSFRLFSTSSSPMLPTTGSDASSFTPEDSSSSSPPSSTFPTATTSPLSLTHLTTTSEIHVVPISHKTPTHRTALATATVRFSHSETLPLVVSASLRKGDVLAVARVAGIQAAKHTSTLVPLCHSGVQIEGVRVWVEPVAAAKKGRGSGVAGGGANGGTDGSAAAAAHVPMREIVALHAAEIAAHKRRVKSMERDLERARRGTEDSPPPAGAGGVVGGRHALRDPKTGKWVVLPAAAGGGELGAAGLGQLPVDERREADEPLRKFLVEKLGKFGGVRIAAEVQCGGKTGVEVEALCAVTGAALSVLDMVKGVDRECVLEEVKVARKMGGRSGEWRAKGW